MIVKKPNYYLCNYRKLKQWERPQDSYFYSYLSVEKADPLDEGEFTCQVIDWGIQQCKSVRLSVIQPLHVNVSPMSATVVKVRTVFS